MEDKKNQEGGEVQENKRRKVSKEHERFDASKKAVLNITKVKDYLNNALYRIDSFKEQIISLVSEEPMVKANDVAIVDQEAAKDITVESVDKKTSEETGSTQIDSEKNLDLEKEVPAELNTIPKGVKENCDIECPTVDEPSTMESSQSTERSVNSKNKCDLTDYLIGDTDSDDDLCLPEETNSGIVITSVKPLSKALLLLNRSANIDNVTKFLENSGVQGIQDIVITKGPFLSTAVVTFDNKDNLEKTLALSKQLAFENATVIIKRYQEKSMKYDSPNKSLENSTPLSEKNVKKNSNSKENNGIQGQCVLSYVIRTKEMKAKLKTKSTNKKKNPKNKHIDKKTRMEQKAIRKQKNKEKSRKKS